LEEERKYMQEQDMAERQADEMAESKDDLTGMAKPSKKGAKPPL
jgi:hypothetical protein